MRNKALVFFLLPALAACGGTTITPPVATTRTAPATAPATIITQTVIDTVEVDYDPTTQDIRFTANGVDLGVIQPRPENDNGRLQQYNTVADGPDHFGYAYQSGNAIAAVLASSGNAGGVGGAYGGLTYSRTGAAVVPLAGAATYAGDYAGLLRDDDAGAGNDNVAYLVNGDLELNADFTNNLISGSITNRDIRHRVFNAVSLAHPVSDVTLQNTLLDDNISFAGNATGGRITAAGWSAAPGTYSGLIAGPEGANEAVGAFTIRHNDGVNAYTEIGIFAGD